MRKLTLASFRRQLRPTPAVLFLAFGAAIVACDGGPEGTGSDTGAAGTTAAKGGTGGTGGTAQAKGGSGGSVAKGGSGGVSAGTGGVSAGTGGTASKGGSGGGGGDFAGGTGGGGGSVTKGGSGGTGGAGGTVSKGGAGGGGGSVSKGGSGGTGGTGGGTAGAGGTTGKLCGGFGGFECGKGQFCNLEKAACGAADGAGVCEDMPKLCPDGCSKKGACGCDGKIYCNECEANQQGVSLAPDSFCDTPDPGKRACGTKGTQPCFKGEFCDRSGSKTCGEADEPGVCKPMPQGCTEQCESPGACGCDGKRHCSACQAEAAGVSVAPNDSYCPPIVDPGARACGTKGTGPCFEGEFCDRSDAKTCGEADEPGTCRPLPVACSQECQVPGVCGCDGQRYCSGCVAQLSGTSVAPNEGYCKPVDPQPGKVCGGFLGTACDKGEYCLFSPEAGCGFADGSGICTPRPEKCTTQCDFAPLCGCDGQLYCNSCAIAQNGVSQAPDFSYCKK